MKIYTSYYKRFDSQGLFYNNMIPVRISTSMPNWFYYDAYSIPELYPGWDLVNGIKGGTITEAEYAAIYKDRLSLLNKELILTKLREISDKHNGADLVLLCYEVPGKFCHRHLVAEWLGNVNEI